MRAGVGRGLGKRGSGGRRPSMSNVHNDIQKTRIVFTDCPGFLFRGYQGCPDKLAFWGQKAMLAGTDSKYRLTIWIWSCISPPEISPLLSRLVSEMQCLIFFVLYGIIKMDSLKNFMSEGDVEMLKKMPTHCGDETCSSCVIAGDFIYLAHHAGGFEKQDIEHQMRVTFERMKNTLESVGATLNDMVQINLYMKDLSEFDAARNVFLEYFDKDCFPARMTLTSDFIDSECLCMMDGVAYRPNPAV